MSTRQENFNGTELSVHETNDIKQWYMTTDEAAKGYGVTSVTIRRHLQEHADEIREGIEKNTVQDMNGNRGNPNKTIIYKEGVIKLGYFIRSKQAAMFRQWATNLIVGVMDNNGITLNQLFEKMGKGESSMNEKFERVEAVCGGLRSDLEMLKSLLHLYMSESDEQTIADLMKKVRVKTGLDGRTIVGNIRKTLNLSSIYDPPHARQVINSLKNMLGEGLVLIQKEPQTDIGKILKK